jgi:hypothetical protein
MGSYQQSWKRQTNKILDEVPSKASFHELFEICDDPNASVDEMVDEGAWSIDFRRNMCENADQHVENPS